VRDSRRDNIRVILENVWDPANANACLRTLEGLGYQNVYACDPLEPFTPSDLEYTRWTTLHKESIGDTVAKMKEDGYVVCDTRITRHNSFTSPSILHFPASIGHSRSLSWFSLVHRYTVLATTLSPTAVDIRRVDLTNRKVALIFGNENRGISGHVRQRLSCSLTIHVFRWSHLTLLLVWFSLEYSFFFLCL